MAELSRNAPPTPTDKALKHHLPAPFDLKHAIITRAEAECRQNDLSNSLGEERLMLFETHLVGKIAAPRANWFAAWREIAWGVEFADTQRGLEGLSSAEQAFDEISNVVSQWLDLARGWLERARVTNAGFGVLIPNLSDQELHGRLAAWTHGVSQQNWPADFARKITGQHAIRAPVQQAAELLGLLLQGASPNETAAYIAANHGLGELKGLVAACASIVIPPARDWDFIPVELPTNEAQFDNSNMLFGLGRLGLASDTHLALVRQKIIINNICEEILKPQTTVGILEGMDSQSCDPVGLASDAHLALVRQKIIINNICEEILKPQTTVGILEGMDSQSCDPELDGKVDYLLKQEPTATVPTGLETAKEDNSAHAVDVTPSLTSRQETILIEMLSLSATSERGRATQPQIVKQCEPSANADSWKRIFSQLVRLGYLDSKVGPDGGCWMTEKGRKAAATLKQ